ncbi:MAG: signal peptide peptidase SppA [Deltaproteobacteria bacterium]|nr:signal peptide peptidase SppA [Deltaproteobacteria bacterium]
MRLLAFAAFVFRAPFHLVARLAAFLRRRAIRPGTWLELELDGLAKERSEVGRLARILDVVLDREPAPEIVLPALRRRLRSIEGDPRIQGVLVRIGAVDCSLPDAVELSERLRALRAVGKKVVAFLADSVDRDAYVIASSAERIIAPPAASIAPAGFASEAIFLKGLLELLGVSVSVAGHGRYKSAPDRFTRTERSEADLEQVSALLDTLDEAMLAAIGAGRGLPDDAIRKHLELTPILAPRAVEQGLLDEVARDEDLPKRISDWIGKSEPIKLLPARAADPAPKLRPILGGRVRAVGVVSVKGAIVDRASPVFDVLDEMAVAERVVSALRDALEDSRIGAVVLHVSSRGGSVTASDAIFSAVRRLDRDKPVIAYLSDVAASGGYYVATGARRIVATPTTVTGSIGVFSMMPAWPRLAERLGLTRDLVSRFANAVPHDPWRARTEAEITRDQAQVDELYDAFVALVAERRGLLVDQARDVAEGRVWSGRAAKDKGLVDELGGLEVALEAAKTEAKGRFALDPMWVEQGPRRRRPSPVAETARAVIGDPRILEAITLGITSPHKALAWAPLGSRSDRD